VLPSEGKTWAGAASPRLLVARGPRDAARPAQSPRPARAPAGASSPLASLLPPQSLAASAPASGGAAQQGVRVAMGMGKPARRAARGAPLPRDAAGETPAGLSNPAVGAIGASADRLLSSPVLRPFG
jgi:hypothetical protein